jgi:hypothetical protein
MEAAAAQRSAPPPGAALRQTITCPLLLLFVIGDVLGAGIYALIGEVADRSGGAIWGAFVVALVLAVFTAFAYAELVTKYPKAAGAALYANKAFRRPLLTFVVAFAVMASGTRRPRRSRGPSAATTSPSSSATCPRCWCPWASSASSPC